MVSVNLTNQDDKPSARTFEATKDHPPFILFTIGQLDVILASADQARQLAGELHRAADIITGMPAWTPPQSQDVGDIQF